MIKIFSIYRSEAFSRKAVKKITISRTLKHYKSKVAMKCWSPANHLSWTTPWRKKSTIFLVQRHNEWSKLDSQAMRLAWWSPPATLWMAMCSYLSSKIYSIPGSISPLKIIKTKSILAASRHSKICEHDCVMICKMNRYRAKKSV